MKEQTIEETLKKKIEQMEWNKNILQKLWRKDELLVTYRMKNVFAFK